MKDELGKQIFKELVRLRAKKYSFLKEYMMKKKKQKAQKNMS